jgi:Histidine kinase-, DNA gyrase B-, and HSP90-like ATPase
MLLKKSDIGGEIISILTRGMYLDPKDTLREYIQNGVDAQATHISIKIRQDIVVVQDNGNGMDRDTMRKSIRVGISDKNPDRNVGFMGIGIYSSFHLCDDLHIYSKIKTEPPNHLHFNFKGMRETLSKQRQLRFSSSLSENEIVALQDLLEENIELTSLHNKDFPNTGTRVEISNLDPTFFNTLSKFTEVSNYLEQVVALPFNPSFTYGKEIQSYISKVCHDNKISYSLVHLDLQINDESSTLYRPYLDENFDPSSLDPKFYTLKFNKEFFGIAWGCLNKSTKTIKNSKLRGFVIKKHGFTIGNRNDLIPYFGRQTFYNRYIGEVIVLHSQLLPNASRSEFEYSPLRISFQDCLKSMATFFNREANEYQETFKALEELDDAIIYLRERKAQFEFYLENSDELLTTLWKTKEFVDSLNRRRKSNYFHDDNIKKADTVINQMEDFSHVIREEIDTRKRKRKRTKTRTESDVASEVENIPDTSDNKGKDEFENLSQVFDSLGLEVNKEMKIFIDLIDENYIRYSSADNTDYLKRLSKLKNDFEELIEE